METINLNVQDIPNWMTPVNVTKERLSASNTLTKPPKYTPSKEIRTLEELQFSNMFESVLDKLSRGIDIREILRSDFRQFPYSRFLMWVDKDPERKQRFEYAERIRAEIVFNEMIAISDGADELSDVSRDRLRIDTRKYTLSVWNKKKFAETKQLDVNTSISVLKALEQADNRVSEIIDVDFEEKE